MGWAVKNGSSSEKWVEQWKTGWTMKNGLSNENWVEKWTMGWAMKNGLRNEKWVTPLPREAYRSKVHFKRTTSFFWHFRNQRTAFQKFTLSVPLFDLLFCFDVCKGFIFLFKNFAKNAKCNIFVSRGPFLVIFWYVYCDVTGLHSLVQPPHRAICAQRSISAPQNP